MKSPREITNNTLAATKVIENNELMILYKNFGLLELKKNNIESGCFYLTNAYVLALEQGLNVAKKFMEF